MNAPKSIRIRCWAHKSHVLDKVPEDARAEAKAYLAAVRETPTWNDGKAAANAFVAKYERQSTKAATDRSPAHRGGTGQPASRQAAASARVPRHT